MHFFQLQVRIQNPVHIIIYIITERTEEHQEKIRKTADDRKTESSRSNAKKEKTGVFRVPKERKKRKASETLNRSNPRSRPKILQYNAGFHLQTMSACLIKTFFRERNTAEKETSLYVFSYAKRKIREKTATFPGNIAYF